MEEAEQLENVMLEELKSIAGWTDDDCKDVIISGRDPVLPTRFMVGEIMGGVHAACGIAASKLWELRRGRRQSVTVNVRAAAATIQSFQYLQMSVDNMPPIPPIMGFFKTRDDRWFFAHSALPHLLEGVLRVLDCENNIESATAAVRRRDSNELEDAFGKFGLCGATVRTATEWAEHPQGIELSRLPVIEILKIGDSPPEPLPQGDRPLSGIRCLDLTRILAGPTASRTLAEHGADVLKIGAEHLPNIPMFAVDTGYGKRSAFLDLRRPADNDKCWELVEQADVFCQSYRLGAIASHGFDPENVVARRPGIVYVSMNCYGPVGPWAGRRGWEQLGQTVTGLALEEGQLVLPPPNKDELKRLGRFARSRQVLPGQPRLLPGAITDYVTGYLLAFGAMVALERRAREGGSYVVRSSLTQAGMCVQRMGRANIEEAKEQSIMLPLEDLKKISIEEDTAFGHIQHLAPVVEMSETPPHWELPVVPLGTHQPVWLERPE
jgi:crotonobetainyl-CoA:carnitine CoA-transferase CaiB-like acyl-CoA transferase